jgi:cytochrome c peroxidase
VKDARLNEGITDKRLKITFHGLRHTHGSWAAQQGVDILTIKEMLGQKTLVMAMRYSHLSGQAVKQGVNKVAEVFKKENEAQEKDPRVAATRRFVAKVYHYEDFRNLKEDPGRYLITKDKKDWKAFKTPTLWEISRTGPYMHNGIFQTLDEVISFFDQGGGKGNAALKPLGLSAKEKKDLKAFLVEGLTGEEIIVKTPKIP